MIKKIIKEPLVHFLFVGFLLFLFFDKYPSNNYSEDGNTIVVNKKALLTLMQYRSKVFKEDFFDKRFQNLKKEELTLLIEDYVREESLYREAKKLNLEDNDYIIKQRLIQKIDFIYKNSVENKISFPQDSLLAYFKKNKERYRVPTQYTFTHIFFKANNKDFPKALNIANSFINKTENQSIAFNKSSQHGDRFLYHTQYVDRDINFIIGHFGEGFASTITQTSSDKSKWNGPIKSMHGYHFVLLTHKKEKGLPEFKDIESTIKEDYKIVYENNSKEKLIKEILDEYNVIIDL